MSAKPNKSAENGCCNGKVVQVSGNRLTSTADNGDEHHYTVDKDAKVTCDGIPSKLADLKTGTPIRMTMNPSDKSRVTAIDSGRPISARAAT